MSKNKNIQTTTDKISDTAKRAGFILMAAAATLGMLDLPESERGRVIVPSQPVFAWAQNGQAPGQQANQMRREREEVAPHYMSYSVAQRTQSRSGRH